MIAAAPRRKNRSLAAASLAAASLALAGCGVNYFQIPLETPIQPKLDITSRSDLVRLDVGDGLETAS